MSTAVAPAPASWRTWWMAMRPRTFGASLAPVLVGWGLAAHAGHFSPVPALAALLGALLLQIGANLANDYLDGVRGADTAERVGPTRVTQAGLIEPGQVKLGATAAFAGATAMGIVMTLFGGWGVAGIGFAALGLAVLYTGGPFPLSYLGLGEVAAFICCGPLAIAGTVLSQARTVTTLDLCASIATGLLAAAIMDVNNTRDREQDAVANKRTLAVRFGDRGARALYFACVLGAFVVPPALVLGLHVSWHALAPLVVLPLAMPPFKLMRGASGPVLNGALAGTGKLMLAFGLFFALGLCL